jgi:hypothetical protein
VAPRSRRSERARVARAARNSRTTSRRARLQASVHQFGAALSRDRRPLAERGGSVSCEGFSPRLERHPRGTVPALGEGRSRARTRGRRCTGPSAITRAVDDGGLARQRRHLTSPKELRALPRRRGTPSSTPSSFLVRLTTTRPMPERSDLRKQGGRRFRPCLAEARQRSRVRKAPRDRESA